MARSLHATNVALCNVKVTVGSRGLRREGRHLRHVEPRQSEQFRPLAVGDEQAGLAPGEDHPPDAGGDDQLSAGPRPRLAPRTGLKRAVNGRFRQPRITGREPFVTLDGVRMSRKKMYFSSGKAARELGYKPRPAREAIAVAVEWFNANGYLQ